MTKVYITVTNTEEGREFCIAYITPSAINAHIELHKLYVKCLDTPSGVYSDIWEDVEVVTYKQANKVLLTFDKVDISSISFNVAPASSILLSAQQIIKKLCNYADSKTIKATD